YPLVVVQKAEKEYWYFSQGSPTSSCVERGDYPKICVSVLLVGPETHAHVHALVVRIADALQHLLRQAVWLRRGEYHDGPHPNCAVADLGRIAVGLARHFAQKRVRPDVNSPYAPGFEFKVYRLGEG